MKSHTRYHCKENYKLKNLSVLFITTTLHKSLLGWQALAEPSSRSAQLCLTWALPYSGKSLWWWPVDFILPLHNFQMAWTKKATQSLQSLHTHFTSLIGTEME
jgi:hypothetical protein